MFFYRKLLFTGNALSEVPSGSLLHVILSRLTPEEQRPSGVLERMGSTGGKPDHDNDVKWPPT